MITRMSVRLRRVRRWFSRSEWGRRWLHLDRIEHHETAPGLLLIQIDGLGHDECLKALRAGRLPFLRRLLEREGYDLKSLYSGVPSTTPAVQAELFYGKKTALPAFSYLEPENSKLVKLFDPDSAKSLEDELEHESEGLMAGGAAYGNIFGGGAEEGETHFCVSALGWEGLWRALNPLTFAMLLIVNIMSVVRIVGLLLIELVLALIDCIKGIGSGHDLKSEVKFLLARVGICIGLRELIAIGASIDLARGLPIVQINLAGFDEQSHRRGPSSAFAHWVLKGIDGTIKRLWHEAKRSPARDYRVWIYSDHGQEDVVPYPELSGERIQDVVRRVVARVQPETAPEQEQQDTAAEDDSAALLRQFWNMIENDSHNYRARTLRSRAKRRAAGEFVQHREFSRPDRTRVIAMGPVGFVYAPLPLSFDEKAAVAELLVNEHQVPAVLGFDGEGKLHGWIKGEKLSLPEDADRLIGEDHPFGRQVRDDLIALCRHAGTGDLVLCGWRAGVEPVSFPLENGSHGGFGPRETHGIALLDSDQELPARDYHHVRPVDLRLAALRLLQQGEVPEDSDDDSRALPQLMAGRLPLRVMTWNVHNCIGMDGHCSSRRIARMIAKFNPSIVAVQELDNGREKTGYANQAAELAALLNMHVIFAPAIREEHEYGIALLSHWPLELVKYEDLPRHQQREQRTALWATLSVGDSRISLITTHLGLAPAERKLQIDTLLGREWVGQALEQGPVVLLGDFNAREKSYVWRRVVDRLRDVQKSVPGWRPRNTWFSTHPGLRLDHIFISPDIGVDALYRPAGTDYQMASDHLPLLADLLVPLRARRPASSAGDGQNGESGEDVKDRDSRAAEAVSARG